MRVLSADSDTTRPPQIELDQLVAADDAVAVPDHMFEKIEDLRFDVDATATGSQFAPVGVKDEMVKKIKQIDGFPNRPERRLQICRRTKMKVSLSAK